MNTNKCIFVGQSSNKGSQAGSIYSENGIAPTICAGTHGYALGFVLTEEKRVRNMKLIDQRCVAMRGRYIKNPNLRISGLPTAQRIEIGIDGGKVSTALTTISKDGMVLEIYGDKRMIVSQNICMGSIDYQVTDKFYAKLSKEYSRTLLAAKIIGIVELCITENIIDGKKVLDGKYRIRRYTPKETLRLMGFKDNDYNKLKEMEISDTAIYKATGNGIVTNCVELIAEHLYKAQYDEMFQTTDEKYRKDNEDYQYTIEDFLR